MSAFTFGALALAALLLIVAALGGRIFGNAMRSRAGGFARAAIGVVGVALVIWALLPYLGLRTQEVRTPDVPAPPASPAVDLVQIASFALQDCPVATAPAVPDANTASLEQMKAAQAAFQAFDAATNAYSKCVDAAVDRIEQQSSGAATAEDLAAVRLFGSKAHNTAIDQEQAVVDQFNTQVRTYKAKHSKS